MQHSCKTDHARSTRVQHTCNVHRMYVPHMHRACSAHAAHGQHQYQCWGRVRSTSSFEISRLRRFKMSSKTTTIRTLRSHSTVLKVELHLGNLQRNRNSCQDTNATYHANIQWLQHTCCAHAPHTYICMHEACVQRGHSQCAFSMHATTVHASIQRTCCMC